MYAGATTRGRTSTTFRSMRSSSTSIAPKVSALLLSMANPRHEHDYHSLERHPLPPGMKLIVGAIDSTTNYVEHPEVVADRIERAAKAVGDPRRMMAGTDCGFDTSAGFGMVADEHRVGKTARALGRRGNREPPPLRITTSHGDETIQRTGNGFAARPA